MFSKTHLKSCENFRKIETLGFKICWSRYIAVISRVYVVKNCSLRPCARAWQWRGGTNVAPVHCVILRMSFCVLSTCTYYVTGNLLICLAIWNTFCDTTSWYLMPEYIKELPPWITSRKSVLSFVRNHVCSNFSNLEKSYYSNYFPRGKSVMDTSTSPRNAFV